MNREPDKTVEALRDGYSKTSPELSKPSDVPGMDGTPDLPDGTDLPLLVRLSKGFKRLERGE